MKLDLKSILTITVVMALIIFTGIVLWKINMDKEIGLIFIMAFIGFANQIASYYFNRNKKKEEEE